MDYYAAVANYPMIVLDVVSEFVHAHEKEIMTFLEAPDEWKAMQSGMDDLVWQLVQSLYGKRTAGTNFRDFWEAIMCSVPDHNYVRGDVEPCLYHSESHHVNLLHHVDDGRVCGPQNALNELIAFLSLYLLLKISEPISTGMAYKYLNRVRLRIENGWVIMPNPDLVERVLSMVGTDQSRPKGFVTPGVHRPTSDPLHDVPCEEVAIFRAATGSLLHFASDVELIAYGVKELARKMHLPTAASYQDLIRMCKYLSDKTHYVIEKTVKDVNAKVHEILIEGDSDCQGDEDSRSTSGAHVEINGFCVKPL